jgi:hypothetical protein
MHKKKQSPKLDFGAEEAEVGLAATKYLSAAHYRTEVKIEINKGLLVTNNRTRAKA